MQTLNFKGIILALALPLFSCPVFWACSDDDDVPDYSGEDAEGRKFVDLGLPSGTLWATCNVGASSPEEYGDYFAWGETTPKESYDWNTYKYCNGSDTMTKYCTWDSYGSVDNKTSLDLMDDAAYKNWGDGWRMPSLEQWTELYENCTWTRELKKGKDGYKVKSKTNRHSIFIPDAGYRYKDGLYHVGSVSAYWTRSLHPTASYNGGCFSLESRNPVRTGQYRYYGHNVRPVRQN